MAVRQLPDAALLRKLLRYDPETGKLYWLPRTPDMFQPGNRGSDAACRSWNAKCAGREALTTLDKQGYQTGGLFGRHAKSHRVIWKIVTGEDVEMIDHINGDKADNRWINLRSVNMAQNMKNAKQRADNEAGCTGVSLRKSTGHWRAYIAVDRRTHNLGTFVRYEDAVRARKTAERRFGFHPNHGRRA